MHAVRSAARPKLSLAMPAAVKPSIPQLVIPMASSPARAPCTSVGSPLTPTARNTMLNQQRAACTLQVPTFERRAAIAKKSKKVSFSDAPARVELISPCPSDYYGDYVKMSREERRWSRSS